MADLNSLMIFARVVEANSFSEAARRLKMPTSTVSRRVAELEDQLGVRLLERSTRSLRLTAVGSELPQHARRSAELSEAVDEQRAQAQQSYHQDERRVVVAEIAHKAAKDHSGKGRGCIGRRVHESKHGPGVFATYVEANGKHRKPRYMVWMTPTSRSKSAHGHSHDQILVVGYFENLTKTK
jgi:molybdenum-dependent DNA-binding transcriptional regulator ModE